MKRKRILCGALVLALLCGCGKQTAPELGTQGSENATEVVAEEASVEAVAESSVSEETSAEEKAEEVAEEAVEDDVALKDLCSEYFTLGVGINGSTLQNQTLNIPQYMELSKKHFNSCTMTNLMKSCYILDQFGSQDNLKNGNEEPALNFMSIDPTLKWCQENDMKMRGHTLVWHTQAPGWFFREGYTDDGEYVDKETMLSRMESYIRQLLTHVQEEYPGVIYCWDVVNEAVDPESADPDSEFQCRTKCGQDPNPWYDTIGPDYVEMAFTYARKYVADDVKLFYNDYNTYQAPKTDGIYTLCNSLKEKGLIDGIGMQGYWGIDYPPIQDIRNAIKKFSELGLEIQVTELSVGVDKETPSMFLKQAEKYEQYFKLLYEMDTQSGGPANITNVTLFGLVDHYREGDTTNSRIFDENYEPKEAFYKIKGVMEEHANSASAFSTVTVKNEMYASASSSAARSGQASAKTKVDEKFWETTSEVKEFSRDGKKIYGELYRPAGDGKFPGIVIAHGFNASCGYAREFAKVLATKGVVAYIFDFIGGGLEVKSDGSMLDMSVLTEAADFNIVFDGIRSLDYVDESRMFVMGESQGGFVATYIAGTRPNDVKGLIALYPAYVLHDGSMKLFLSFLQIPSSVSFLGVTVGRRYFTDLLSFDIYKVMANFKGKTVIVHGTKDDIVPISCSEKASKIMADAKLIPVEDAYHGFGTSDVASAAAIDLIKQLSNS
ncbi:MAG: endo-1,4-beta-xylanase [Butyrivibrio sp.]|nr:endo-1,4-beta-xylanase [Butyrivibrio sp.]